jgi:PAS domain S-box-containing protein
MNGEVRSPHRALLAILWGLQIYVILGGLVSFIGWAADVPRLTDWHKNGISIQPNTTIAVMSAGVGLTLLTLGHCRPAAAFGVFVALIGGSALFQHFSGIDLGVDTLLMFDRTWGRVGVLSPGRMGPSGATSWTLVGIALFLASFPKGSRVRRSAATLAVISASISGLALIGYLYKSSNLYSLPRSTVIALQTASFIQVISVGLILSVPERGLMRVLSDPSAGGVLARRILPAIILVPILIGFVPLRGERAALYDTASGSALRTVIEILLFMMFLWWTGTAINRHAKRHEIADRASRANRQRVVDTLESITDAFVTFDREWRFTYVNAEAERLLRKNRRDLLGHVVWKLFPDEVGGVAYKELHRVAAERVSATFEAFSERLQLWFLNKAYPSPDGAIAVYFEDVTERKRAEDTIAELNAQLSADLSAMTRMHGINSRLVQAADVSTLLQEIVDAAVAITDADMGNIQLLEEGALRIAAQHGFEPPFLNSFDVVHEGLAACGVALLHGKRIVVEDITESPIFVGTPALDVLLAANVRAVQSTPLVSHSGLVLGMFSTHYRVPHQPSERELRMLDLLARQAADLIEHRQAEKLREELLERERAARSDAERAARLKDEFLATLSHELRTPLNAVIGWTQILKKDVLDPEKVRSAAEVIERNGRLQAKLITDLLDISRVISGKMRLDIQPVSLAGVTDAAIDSIVPAAYAKGVRIERAIEPLSEPINGDPARLQQVVWNLLSNAVKFTPRGGAVQVMLARCDSHVEIRVSDTGEGIAPEFVPYIFERFRQADASASRSHGGLGLGLALVKQFVELHGGKVRAASEGLGKGSTFVIELPLGSHGEGDREGHPLQRTLEALEPTRQGGVPLKGIRVLVVDDEPDALAMVRRVLEESEAAVSTALSSDAALGLLERESFDVIVSDIGMPNGDGYKLIADARARGIHTPAVALTAFARVEDRMKAMSSGYQAHLPKPVETNELLGTVASLAGGRHATSASGGV